MSRSSVVKVRGRRVGGFLATLLIGLLAVPAAALACGEDGTEDTGPLVTEAQLSPASLPSAGGTGKISARVADDCGVQQVYVEISSTQGSYLNFEMVPSDDINSNERLYRAEFQVPANFSEEALSYQGTVSVEDTNGAFAGAYAGEIEVAGAPQFDEPPVVSDSSVEPNLWGGFGGESTIELTATDNRGVANAFAVVIWPDGSVHEMPLNPVSASRFEAALSLPVNHGVDPLVYSVSAFAEDDIGQQTGAYAGVVTVEPKGTPNPGRLSIRRTFLHFRAVPIGGLATQDITLSNTGRPGSPRVTGFLRSSDSQFLLPGGGLEGLPFSLLPGQDRVVEVSFRPNARPQQTGRLTLVRDDGRRQEISVLLYGWGSK